MKNQNSSQDKMSTLALKEVITNEVIIFYVLDAILEIFSTQTAYGWKTVVLYDGNTFYLDNDLITINTAIYFYQKQNNRLLTESELEFVMEDNKQLLSEFAEDDIEFF